MVVRLQCEDCNFTGWQEEFTHKERLITLGSDMYDTDVYLTCPKCDCENLIEILGEEVLVPA